eukprot:3265741-Prorocentrum_lima.AAC.1
MTSSLVGSEMCIRDSVTTTTHPIHTSHPPPTPSTHHNDRPRHPDITATVSYTHLTLPTICSV